MHKEKLKRLQEKVRAKGIDVLLMTSLDDVRYLTGFCGSSAFCLVSKNRAFFCTDFRYKEEVSHLSDAFEIVITKKDCVSEIVGLARKERWSRIGLDFSSMTMDQFNYLHRAARRKKWISAGEVVSGLRMIKGEPEIAAIKQVIKASQRVYEHIRRFIGTGKTEQAIAAEMEYVAKKRFGMNTSFETIVASGPHAALPHAKPTTRKILPGEPVVIDFGLSHQGYVSDLTRTYFAKKISPDIRDIYALVYEAQQRAIKAIRPGVSFAKVDAAARRCIEKAGYGEYFGHALGHGLGCEVHEAPTVSSRNKKRLRSGMVFTVEPGIYVPGLGGVRIEDVVVVRPSGCELLSSLPRSLWQAIL